MSKFKFAIFTLCGLLVKTNSDISPRRPGERGENETGVSAPGQLLCALCRRGEKEFGDCITEPQTARRRKELEHSINPLL